MKSKISPDKTIASIDLNISTIELAEKLGLDLSEMANRLLKLEVKKRRKEIKAIQGQAEVPA